LSNPWTLDRIFRLFLALVLLGAFLWLAATLSEVLIPFGLAFLLAYMINPLVLRVQKRVRSRTLAVVSTLLMIFVLFVGLAALVIAPIHSQMAHAGELLTRALSDSDFSTRIAQYIPSSWWSLLRSKLAADNLLNFLSDQNTLNLVEKVFAKVLPSAFSLMSGTLSVLLWFAGFTMVLIYLFFMMLDFDGLRSELTSLIPSQYREDAFAVLRQFDLAMSNYFRAQALISLINGTILAVGFSIIGLPLGILFGFIAGLMTMVPYLQLASIPIAALLALLHCADSGQPYWVIALLILAVYGVMQMIQDFVLVPRFIGNASGLSPVMIMLALSIWGKLLGFFGLIVAIPFTCLVLAYYRKLLAERKSEMIP